MRVLAVTPTFFPIVGGAELLIRDVVNVWSEQHEVRLVTRNLPKASEAFWTDDGTHERSCRFEIERFDDRLSLLDLRGHRVSRGLVPPTSLTAFGEIGDAIGAMRPDVLVGFFGIPYGLPMAYLAARHRLPLVLVLCGNDIPSPRTEAVPFWSTYLRRVTDAADRVVYVSRFCFDALHGSGWREPHDNVIYGGMDLDVQAAGDPARLRRELGIAPDDVMVFTLSRLGPEKRVDVLVRALAAMPPTWHRVKLVIGGQGSEADGIAQLARELGVERDVVMAGHLDAEKHLYYRACDVFAFHSLFETFGQVLVEAMAAGKPVVSVRAGAIPEVMKDGVTGLLADPMDPRGIARRLVRLADDEQLREVMGRAGRERAERLFDWSAVRGQWADLLTFAQPEQTRGPECRRALTHVGV